MFDMSFFSRVALVLLPSPPVVLAETDTHRRFAFVTW
jgi:hypothetical protein